MKAKLNFDDTMRIIGKYGKLWQVLGLYKNFKEMWDSLGDERE
jgi:hypothetical protein